MSLASVKAFFSEHAPDIAVIELDTSTATVDLAAQAHGVEAGQIAKTLAFWVGERVVLVVARGDVRIDNRKFKTAFAAKGKMLSAEEVLHWTGHPVGGVCPFGLAQPCEIFLDESLHGFTEVLPAAGCTRSAVRLSPARLQALTHGQWVDVCQAPVMA